MLMQKWQLTKTINVSSYKVILTHVYKYLHISKNFCTDLIKISSVSETPDLQGNNRQILSKRAINIFHIMQSINASRWNLKCREVWIFVVCKFLL